MSTSTCAIGFVALLQIYFMILEMFLWQNPKTLKKLGMTAELASSTATLAKNQGLYNGFLAAGLIWGLFETNAQFVFPIHLFFLTCIFIAGVYGGLTASRKILLLQAVPAGIALVLLIL